MEDSHSNRSIAAPAARRKLAARLLAWYDDHARDLAWRADRDPYRVWVSEIMLQQTQVATVEAYFKRFVAEFPTVDDLARAPLDRVLRLWEGLGYYRRARQMHLAARQVVDEHGGQFPRTAASLAKLAGIGRYTAGAIASIAFDERAPILEANTTRLLARLVAYDEPTHTAAGQRLLWHVAEAILPPRDTGRFNQALMELGSQVCRPREPDCVNCPLRGLCGAYAISAVDRIPRAKPQPRFEDRREGVVVVERRARLLLVRRGEGGRWAGLWDFPRFELPAAADEASAAALEADTRRVLAEATRAMTGLEVAINGCLATLRHGVTRFRITLECHTAECLGGRLRPAGVAEARWVARGELDQYPLNVTGRRIASLLEPRRNAGLHHNGTSQNTAIL